MIVHRELSSLEKDLGFHAKTLYAVSNNLGKHYHNVQLPKKSGGIRKLSVPDELLKSIQRKITDVLLISMPVSQYAKAYRYGSSTIRNARHHVGKKVVLKLDILHFFLRVTNLDTKLTDHKFNINLFWNSVALQPYQSIQNQATKVKVNTK